MNVDIRFPNITAHTSDGKLQQFQDYLYQLVQQLNWALGNIDGTGGGASVSARTVVTAPQESNAVGDSLKTFNSIKGLIIKSADIVNAYYEKIDNLLKLSGEYVAEATFPEGSATFIEKTSASINANDKTIEQFYTDLQKVISDIESVEDSLIEVNAHIRSGLLDYDTNGVPVYGLEIGQKTVIDGEESFNKYARFTSEKLAFYDSNDNEVAYISDKKLYITHVEITGSFSCGGFVDTVIPGAGVVTKWIGGGG